MSNANNETLGLDLKHQVWYMTMAVKTLGGDMPNAILASLEELRAIKESTTYVATEEVKGTPNG
jgi:hypothetical protein